METINTLLERGILIDPDLLQEIERGSLIVPENLPDDILILERDHLQVATKPSVEVTYSYNKESKKRSYNDFVQYWRHRFNGLSAILRSRQELQGVTSISRLIARREDNNVAVIGMVANKQITKNNNIILTLEDTTGEITVIVHIRNPKLVELAKDIVLDEVIGITGGMRDKTIFADKILFPDVPLSKELKKQREEEYMIVVGDPQVGGKEFMKEEWGVMSAWLNGKVGNTQQQTIASKVKYVIFVGDVVEGVGVYPGQEEDLEIPDIKGQYDAFAQYLKKFPKDVEIIICPGNHDAGRIAEPQPPLYKDFAQSLYELPNVTIVSSPSYIRIGATNKFPGFDILLYHGYSIPYYADNIPSIRNAGGQKATDRIMKFYLQRRHLAPTHGSNLYVPDAQEDPLIISKVPDFFLTGHIHRIATANYRNVTMINAGAWTDISEDQLKRGLEPQPARLPIVNLKTREVRIMNFYREDKQ